MDEGGFEKLANASCVMPNFFRTILSNNTGLCLLLVAIELCWLLKGNCLCEYGPLRAYILTWRPCVRAYLNLVRRPRTYGVAAG